MKLITLQVKAQAAYEKNYDEHGPAGTETIQALQVLATLAVADFAERIALTLEAMYAAGNKPGS